MGVANRNLEKLYLVNWIRVAVGYTLGFLILRNYGSISPYAHQDVSSATLLASSGSE